MKRSGISINIICCSLFHWRVCKSVHTTGSLTLTQTEEKEFDGLSPVDGVVWSTGLGRFKALARVMSGRLD